MANGFGSVLKFIAKLSVLLLNFLVLVTRRISGTAECLAKLSGKCFSEINFLRPLFCPLIVTISILRKAFFVYDNIKMWSHIVTFRVSIINVIFDCLNL